MNHPLHQINQYLGRTEGKKTDKASEKMQTDAPFALKELSQAKPNEDYALCKQCSHSDFTSLENTPA